MGTNDKYQNVSNRIIDMLVDSTLKRHEINLEAKDLEPKVKKELRDLLEELQNSIRSLTKENEKQD